MRTLASLLLITIFVACNSTLTPANEEASSTLKEKTVLVDDPTTIKITSVLGAYEALRDSLIEYNTTAVDTAAQHLQKELSDFGVDAIKDKRIADSVKNYVAQMQVQSKAIVDMPSLEAKKRAFSILSNAFYSMLTATQYNTSIIYKQTCPMAFNDTESASWISRSSEINNPYLGKKHPKYASGMLHCGEVTDSVAFKK